MRLLIRWNFTAQNQYPSLLSSTPIPYFSRVFMRHIRSVNAQPTPRGRSAAAPLKSPRSHLDAGAACCRSCQYCLISKRGKATGHGCRQMSRIRLKVNARSSGTVAIMSDCDARRSMEVKLGDLNATSRTIPCRDSVCSSLLCEEPEVQ